MQGNLESVCRIIGFAGRCLEIAVLSGAQLGGTVEERRAAVYQYARRRPAVRHSDYLPDPPAELHQDLPGRSVPHGHGTRHVHVIILQYRIEQCWK